MPLQCFVITLITVLIWLQVQQVYGSAFRGLQKQLFRKNAHIVLQHKCFWHTVCQQLSVLFQCIDLGKFSLSFYSCPCLKDQGRLQGAVQFSSKAHIHLFSLSLHNGDMSVFPDDWLVHRIAGTVVTISCLVISHMRHLKVKSKTNITLIITNNVSNCLLKIQTPLLKSQA